MKKHSPLIPYGLLLLGIICFITNPCKAFTNYAPPIAAKQGLVVTEQRLASEVGVNILRQGGNAIDAAVAVGYALAVVNPCCGNLGGGGFMLIHFANGKDTFLNFREKAPLAAQTKIYLNKKGDVIENKSKTEYSAVAVPGTVLGLEVALQKYGTLTRQQVIAPAIALAQHGFILTTGDIELLNRTTENFYKDPKITAIFLKNGHALQIGDRLVQKDLAYSLKQISKHGSAAFYKGPITDTIVKASRQKNGILTKEDFARYNVAELEPIRCKYRGYTIVSAAPPSSGGIVLCEMLNILEGYPLQNYGFHSAQSAHYFIEAMRYAYFDRNKLGDATFTKNPIHQLLSKDYAAKIRQHIQANHASSSYKLIGLQAKEGEHTTHYSVMDKWGNAVAVTYTLNSLFGAEIIAGNSGFFLNNSMDDFTIKPDTSNQFGLMQGRANSIQPEKRPLSSMTPTFVMKNNKILMVLGCPGGPRIITAVLETMSNVLDYHMDIQAAVDAPRFHHQWLPDQVDIEPFVFSASTTAKLITMGYEFQPRAPWGAVEAIYVDPTTNIRYGGSDSRRPAGAAIGY